MLGLLYLPFMIGVSSLLCAVMLALTCGLLWIAGQILGASLLGWLTPSHFVLTSLAGGVVLFVWYKVRVGS